MTTHRYASDLSWNGSTAEGYDGYSREHSVTFPSLIEPLSLSSDTAFGGDSALPNPEALLLAALSSCQLLSFLALAARSRVDVVAYSDSATAEMPDDDPPVRITTVTLRPQITVAAGGDVERVTRLVQRAHETCFIANTVSAAVDVEPKISVEGE